MTQAHGGGASIQTMNRIGGISETKHFANLSCCADALCLTACARGGKFDLVGRKRICHIIDENGETHESGNGFWSESDGKIAVDLEDFGFDPVDLPLKETICSEQMTLLG